jgi:hypothetical protein
MHQFLSDPILSSKEKKSFYAVEKDFSDETRKF